MQCDNVPETKPIIPIRTIMKKFGIEIKIKKFGPVKNTTIRLSPLTIFTGESNLGKSYVNYLVYYVFHFLTGAEIDNFFASKFRNKKEIVLSVADFEKEMSAQVEDFMRDFLQSSTIECDVSYKIIIPPIDKIHIKYDTEVMEEISVDGITMPVDSIKKEVLNVTINDDVSTFSYNGSKNLLFLFISIAFNRYIQTLMFGKAYRKLLLPPARGAFAGLGFFTKDFMPKARNMYDRYRTDMGVLTYSPSKIPKHYSTIVEKIVGGQLTIEKGNQYLKLADESSIPLTAAASSIKELSPLIFALPESSLYEIAFCIEEPEAHLHPQMQIGVADLMATCLNDKNIFHFTTHSDYILQRINQLIKLNYVRKKDNAAFNQICEKYGLTEYQCINKDKVTVYNFSMGVDGVNVEELNVTEKGIPMKTFFGVVQDITRVEDNLNYAIRKIEGGEDNDD